MIKQLYLAMGTSTLLLTACASNNIAENQHFTSSGIIYTEQVEQLLIEARELIISNHSEELARSSSNKNIKHLLKTKKTETLREVKEIEVIIALNQVLEDYIRKVEKLINDPGNQSAEKAVSDASTLILQEHMRQRSGGTYYSTSFDSVGSVQKLAALGMSAYNAKRVQTILKRNAPLISALLSTQKARIEAITQSFKGNLKTSELMFYNDKVKKPLVSAGSGRLNPLWKNDYRTWVNMNSKKPKTKALIEAQKNIEKAWHNILQGNLNVSSVSHHVADMSVTAKTVRQFEDAH